MKRPWQIWLCYALCLACVLPAMAWLTYKALESDRMGAESRQAAEVARRQAEIQELVGSALWRMDWTLTPLIAQEAARPYYVYEPFYASSDSNSGKQQSVRYVPSPLLVQPSEYVLLHFQVTPSNDWNSPQNPTGMLCTPAIQNGATLENIQASGERLSLLRQQTNYSDLLHMCPDRLLPQFDFPLDAPPIGNSNSDPLRDLTWDAFNDLGLSQVTELSQSQAPLPGGRESPPSQQLELASQQPPARQATLQSFEGVRSGNSPSGNTQSNSLPSSNSLNRNSQTGARRQPASQQQQRQQIDPQATGSAPNQQAAPPPAPNAPPNMPLQRAENEWEHRNRAYQSYANNYARNQRSVFEVEPGKQILLEGVSRPLWVGDRLLMARRAVHENEATIQGCWLDWERIREVLLAEIQDLLPNAQLLPVTKDSVVPPGRLLATLPVQLVVGAEPSDQPPRAGESTLSAIRISLLAAWSGLLLAAVAVAVLLQGVITLSERRAAFVSAVTHELRTPLTTFRMYAEMLAEGMVRGAEQTTVYLETLRVEADRLTHLVENVLLYARLERSNPRRSRLRLPVADLLNRFQERLSQRAEQAEMDLLVSMSSEVAEKTIDTDPAAVEQIVFNLVDNACKYARDADDRRIQIVLEIRHRGLELSVRDFGPGVSLHQARHLFRPFCKSADEAARSAPGVGLGLALSRRLAQDLGGQLTWKQDGESGACFVLRLPVR